MIVSIRFAGIDPVESAMRFSSMFFPLTPPGLVPARRLSLDFHTVMGNQCRAATPGGQRALQVTVDDALMQEIQAMPLNPQAEAILAALATARPAYDFTTLTPDEMRAAADNPIAIGDPPEVAHAESLVIALPGRNLEARLYVPHGAAQTPPLAVFYHGGGWVIGTLDTHDGTCRALARASGAAVLSVGYRLAPEHAFPAPLDDCFDALVWAQDNAAMLGVDGTRLAVAGDSAGGNLAAAVAIMARDRKGPALRHQLLIYPVTDLDFETASYRDNGGGEYFLGTAMMQWFWLHYVGAAAACDVPLAAVMQVPDLSGLAPATVYTAEFDPLRDEGMAYAERLQQAGVETEAAVAPGMIHGFVSMFQMIPDAMPWIERGGARLKQALER